MEKETPWGLFLLLLVVVLSGFAIHKAIQQRESREHIINSIILESVRLDNNINTNTQLIRDVQNDLSIVKSKVNSQESQFLTVAGCYGIIYSDSQVFNLTCDKNFHLD